MFLLYPLWNSGEYGSGEGTASGLVNPHHDGIRGEGAFEVEGDGVHFKAAGSGMMFCGREMMFCS